MRVNERDRGMKGISPLMTEALAKIKPTELRLRLARQRFSAGHVISRGRTC
jgi:hypothetical protein